MSILKFSRATAAAILLASVNAFAADKIIGGPRGGRLLENRAPRADFFVQQDRKVSITFYDASLKAVPAAEQVVTAVAETKSGKVALELEKKDGGFVSKSPIPEGDGYNVVVQIKAGPDAKPQNFRIKYDAEICHECKRAEYACTCGH